MDEDRQPPGSGRLEPWQSHVVGLVLTIFTAAAVISTLMPPGSPAAVDRISPAGSVASAARADVQASPRRTAAITVSPAVPTPSKDASGAAKGPLLPLPPLPPLPGTEPEPDEPDEPQDSYRPIGRREAGLGSEVRAVPVRSVEGTSQKATVRSVLTLKFKTRKGERRLVAAQIKAYQPEDTPDQLVMASTSLSCSPTAKRVRSSGATQNLVRGKSAWLSMAFVYVAPRTETVSCVVRAYGSRPRPGSSGRDGWNRWYVWHGSRLFLGKAQPYWAASASKKVKSRLIGRGQTTSTLSRYAAGSSGTSRILVVADHKLTTCSSARGSRDTTTGRRELCAGHVKKTGSRVRLVVRVLQGDGTRCTSRPVVNKVYTISARMHHRTIRGLTVLEPTTKKCHGTLTVSTTLKNIGGAPVMVHTTFGRTSIAQG